MTVAGVIAEYNPFHRGHAWQLGEIRRRLGADAGIVICMSGNFVQRGDFALLNKHARAEMALEGGADLVLELPTPWACAGAERFAQGGVAALAGAGVVTHLAFGSECGDLELLSAAADVLEDPVYDAGLVRFTGEGMTFAAARQAVAGVLLERRGKGEAVGCLTRPNDILAVEYLRALRGTGLRPMALPRIGAAHDSREEGEYSSASAVRRAVRRGGDWREMLPASSARILAGEMEAGRAPVFLENCQLAVLSQLRRMDEEDFRPYDGGNEGLYRRFYRAVHTGVEAEDILRAAKTKRYPMARLRRMLLQSYLEVPQAAQGETPPYLRVLGANGRGRELLGRMRKTASLPVITKPGHVRRLGAEAQRVFDLEARCTDLYVLACPELGAPESEYRAGPVML